LYHDFPRGHVWKTKEKVWESRKRQGTRPPVGRMYYVPPSEGERFYLRTLLHAVPGATSFEDLRTTGQGGANDPHVVHPTFKAACLARGLLQDDAEWERCMHEAAVAASPSQLRALFATILAFNDVSDPLALWNCFKLDLAEDFLHQARRQNPSRELDDFVLNQALRHLDALLQSMNSPRGLADFHLPIPTVAPSVQAVAEELARYDARAQAALRDRDVPLLNQRQREAYDAVLQAIYCLGRGGNLFLLDGPGGTGKTFLYSCLLSTVRARNKVPIAVASSGIAARLLEGGCTAHPRFKFPVRGLNTTSSCYITRSSDLAKLIQAADIVIWDEAPMMHRHVFEAVDRSFRDVMAGIRPEFRRLPFGGKVFVMGGDFRQVLPVVQRGSRADIIDACLKSSQLWQHVRVYKLQTNMRVQRLLSEGTADAVAKAAELQDFAEYLERIGDGTEPVYHDIGEDFVLIPPNMCCSGNTIQDLIEEVYGGIQGCDTADARKNFLAERAILTPLNENVDVLNVTVNGMYDFSPPGCPNVKRAYCSADSVVEGEQAGFYPVEFLKHRAFLWSAPTSPRAAGRLPYYPSPQHDQRLGKWYKAHRVEADG
jgi:ATP-dependent DNA helicase PIF1